MARDLVQLLANEPLPSPSPSTALPRITCYDLRALGGRRAAIRRSPLPGQSGKLCVTSSSLFTSRLTVPLNHPCPLGVDPAPEVSHLWSRQDKVGGLGHANPRACPTHALSSSPALCAGCLCIVRISFACTVLSAASLAASASRRRSSSAFRRSLLLGAAPSSSPS